MKAAALCFAALALAPALAGCAFSRPPRCTDGFPLVLRAYPEVMGGHHHEFQTMLWNCTSETIPLDEPCEARNGLMPRTVLDGVPYYVPLPYDGNRSLVTRDRVVCNEVMPPASEAPPGYTSENRYWWDGTYFPPGATAPVPVPNGTYEFSVQAGLYRREVEVTVPWERRA